VALVAASRFFIRSYAASSSLSSSRPEEELLLSCSEFLCGDSIREGCASVSRSDSDASPSDSALLSDDLEVGFRRAARSPPRGFTDASDVRVDGCARDVSMLKIVMLCSLR
jgi:hypothetical protein